MHRRLSFALVIIVAASVLGFMWRRWLPPLASAEGMYVDRQMRLSLLVLGIIFVLAHVVLATVIWRYRERGRSADAIAGSYKIELAWMAVVMAILAGLAFTGANAMAATRTYAERNTIHLEATGMQFQWYFRYAGPDGVFGETKPELIDASVGNPLGIDPADRDGRDDVVSTYAVVPLGHTIDVALVAQDVIHSFFMPAMRIKMDAVPGLNTHVRFTPTKLGSFEVACAELCGLGHYRMNTQVHVV
ncbi:MAG: hypothetical protein ABI383_11405, partial [Acidobacteriaceae bacterium]